MLGIWLSNVLFDAEADNPSYRPWPYVASGLVGIIGGVALDKVGDRKVRRAVDAYNQDTPKGQDTSGYWSIGAGTNGLGIAYRF